MKKLIMITASFLCAFGISAQTVETKKCEEISKKEYCVTSKDGQTILTKDGQPMPGAVVVPAVEPDKPVIIPEKKYCVSIEAGRALVTSEGQIIYSPVVLESGAEISPDGSVLWRDKSRTILKDGACVDVKGVISAPPTSSMDVQPEQVRTPDGNASALQQVTVTDQKTTVTASNTTDNKDIAPGTPAHGYGFTEYANQAKAELADNDSRIDAIKIKANTANDKAGIKQGRQAIELEKENNRMKSDLQNYISFGTGDWKVFKKQFDKDLRTFQRDMHNLDYMFDDSRSVNAN